MKSTGKRRATGYRATALMCAAAVLAGAWGFPALADSKKTEQQLKDARNAANQTQEAIDQNQDNIDSLNQSKGALENQKSSLESQLSGLNQSLQETAANLSELEDKISARNSEIETTTQDLEAAQKTADDQYAAMKKRIQFMYERSRTTFLDAFLRAGSLGEFLNFANYLNDLETYDRKKLQEYEETERTIAEKKAALEQQKAELEDLKSKAQAEQDRVSALVGQTRSNISSTEGSISQYSDAIQGAEAAADALQNQLAQQNSTISALEKQLAEERRLEAASKASVWRSIGDVTFAEGDRTLLANLIYCEAGGEPYDGQLAVGAVVINRVLSGAFPGTVVGVIYQSGQFAPVSDGHLAIALAEDRATESCYQAADAAMAGQTNVADCIFFRTPIPQVTPRYTIGGHIFY